MVDDAFFVRDKFLPQALENERWNIVVYEAYRIIELLLKGMISLSGFLYLKDHNLEKVLVDYLQKLSKYDRFLPFSYRLVSKEIIYYFLDMDFSNNIRLLKYKSNTFTELAGGNFGMISNDDLPSMGLKYVKNSWKFFKDGLEVLSSTDVGNIDNDSFGLNISLPKMLNPERVININNIASELLENREIAFYTEKIFSPEDASEAISKMNKIFELSTKIVENVA